MTDGAPGPPASIEVPGRPRRPWWRLGLATLLLVVAVDAVQPPARQPSARFLLAGIRWYQATLSARLSSFGVACRFTPTCSRYAAAVIARDGTWPGLARSSWRILRCGPWTPLGTADPP
jgi:putative membrane protein insertion efficiency factor